ncbi:RING finger protein 39-like [Apus apus]|uniref:RING finger protein 39-like n=1 Tax=Apus apus TaxID=8895 RepID=UPI0021F8A98D|nr:RING finger protein 39-like [Apus apus]
MAAVEELREEATCSICLELFRAPVMLGCGHNFCRGCIALCWARAAPSCPQCREPLPGRRLRPNRPLGNIAERLRRGGPARGARGEAPAAPGRGAGLTPPAPGGPGCAGLRSRCCRSPSPRSVARCNQLPPNPLVPLPPVTGTLSLQHSHPQDTESSCGRITMEGFNEKEQIESQLESLRREKGELEEQKKKEQGVCQDCLEKVKLQKQKIVPEFKQLRQYLVEQECLLLAQLGELEKQIETRLKENAAKFSKKIFHLDGLIKEKEHQLLGQESLQDTGDVLSRCESIKLQQKEQLSHEWMKEPNTSSGKVSVARKPQDALTTDTEESVEESQGLYTKVSVTLDPDTAQSRLVVSEDRRCVAQGVPQQSQLDNPKKFDPWPCVLGCEGFDSGKPCWEVEVGYGSAWAVGVALESVKRKGPIDMSPTGGIWAVGQYKEKFQALTSPSPTPVLPSTAPRRVRVCLDHAGGQVLFVDVLSQALIFTFPRAVFAGKRIHPWFWVGKGSQLKLS